MWRNVERPCEKKCGKCSLCMKQLMVIRIEPEVGLKPRSQKCSFDPHGKFSFTIWIQVLCHF
jgi:hypothetical protein